MTQSSPIEPYNEPSAAIADYRQQARQFLVKSHQYLADDDLHQAAEKGWGAAAWMAKAVAAAQGWQYVRHDEFADVINRARILAGDERLRNHRRVANELHGYFYTRKRFLDPEDIKDGLDLIAELLDILEPLTENSTT